MNSFAYFYWDPHPEAFRVPFLDHPVAWYGILFVTKFILAYFIINPILARFLIQSPPLIPLWILLTWPTNSRRILRTSSPPLLFHN